MHALWRQRARELDRRQPSTGDRPGVSEATGCRERCEVGEGGAEVSIPELELAHAGRIQHESAPGDDDELTPSGRVPALTVRAELGRRKPLVSEEPVRDRRFPHAGGAEAKCEPAQPPNKALKTSSNRN